MAEETIGDKDVPPADGGDETADGTAGGRAWWAWLAGVLLLVVLAVAAAVPVGLWWLAETPGGRAFVAGRVSGLEPASGIRYEVGRIDGSLLSTFTLVDVVVKDLDGTLALIPRAEVDWEPITLVSRLVSINRLDVPEIRLLRMWALNARDPDEPLLPDIDVRIGRFALPRVVLEKPVLGREEQLSANGRVEIRSGRVLLDMKAASARGDGLLLLLDAEPDRDRFDLEADVSAPVGGTVATAAGLQAPLRVSADGAGSWSRWRGRLAAELGEGATKAEVADLAVTADDGRFRVAGTVSPAPILGPGLLADLSAPAIAVEAEGFKDGDWFDLKLSASSAALQLTGGGRIDATDNVADGVRLALVVRDPVAVNPALSGTGLEATLAVDGPLKDTPIAWTVAADTLRFRTDSGLVGADGVVAEGTVRLAREDRPLAIPFTARARRTVGLPPEVAALLEQPRASGTIRMADGRISANDVRLVTSRMTVTGTAARGADGGLGAQLEAAVSRLQVPGLGVIDLRATATVAQRPGAERPAVAGRFDVKTLSLANASARDFLGGLPRATGNFALGADGAIALSGAQLTSPNLKVTGAKGRYDPASGRFAIDASGRSQAYGAFTVSASGTSAAPRGTITLAAPGFGFGVTDVVAEITPAPGGVLLVARGDSPQGPLDGRIRIGFGNGQPLVLDIERAGVAGLEARGRLVQTPAGPFVGRLVVDGRGLEAQLALSAVGALQQVDGTAQALNARIPLETPIAISKGAARFTVLLAPERPVIRGSFAATGVRRDTLVLTDVSGSANLTGTAGVATVTAKGRAGDGQAFAAVGRVQSIADGYAISLDGSLGKLPLKLERPARLVRVDGGWRLLPATLVLPKGQVDVAAELGTQREVRMALRNVDLSILDLVSSRFGFGGTANGQLLVRTEKDSRIPVGEANLTITGLQRPGVTGITVPVDVRLSARSDGGGLVLGAKLSWQKNDLGRLVLRVDPGPGETPAERFAAGRLSGGVRYNGPVEPLWALGGFEGQELKGAIAVGADFSGTPSDPMLTGIARGKGLIYRNAAFGTEIVDLAFDGAFSGDLLRVNSITGRANGGTITGSGFVRLGLEQTIDLSLQLERARLANSDTLEFTLSGPLKLQGGGAKATLSGDLRVDSARVQLVQVETSEIPQLQVRRAGEVRVPEPEPTLSAANIALDVRVRADDRVQVDGMGLESVWRGDIRVRGTPAAPIFLGTATLARGEFSFASSTFELKSGRVGFNGRPLDSSINIQAQTQAQEVTAFVNISGTAGKPDIRFSSSPSLPEDEILSRLLFGASVADLSVTEAVQLATAVAGLQSGTDTMGKIRRSVGVDRLRIVGDNAETGMGTGIAIGKRLTRNVYVEVLTDSQGNTLTTLQLTLSRIWSLFVEVSSQGNSSVNVRYQRER
jgi:translocation and assembly module TamB